MDGQVFHLGRGKGLVPIDRTSLQIGQRVIQAYKGEKGVICKADMHGYLVIFEDGDFSSGQQLDSLSPYTRIEIDDLTEPLATQDEVEELLRRKAAKIEADNRAREEESKKKAEETQEQVKELQAKYSWAISASSGMSSHARAAKNLKLELQRVFPGIKFSVKSESFSMGNSIDVRWTLGPTTKQVESVSSKYQKGNFDGMQDMYEYDNSAYSNAVSQVLGQAKYVSEQRDYPNELRDKVGEALCELQRIQYQGLSTRYLLGEGDSFDLSDHVYQLLARTSFAPSEEFQGVEYTPDSEEVEVRDWCRIVKSKPPQVEPAANNSLESEIERNGVTLTENRERGGIELRFPSKPSSQVLESLKANGWRWSRFNACWYAKATDRAREFARGLIGVGESKVS